MRSKTLPHWLLATVLLFSIPTLWAADSDGDNVPDAPSTVDIGVGDSHICALDSTGVHCWGYGWKGQLSVPTGLVNPTKLSVIGDNNCVLDDAGVHCWGDNSSGQTDVPPLTHPVAVTAGGTHSCAIDDTGVVCWGENTNGQLNVPALNNPTAIGAGISHTCALDDDGVHCWGRSDDGLTDVPSLSNPTMLSVGAYHACALDDNGVQCWGWNSFGERDIPTLINPVAVSAGFYTTCAIDSSGLHCWGENGDGQTSPPALVENPVAVSAGKYAACVLDGTRAQCWGSNYAGLIEVPASLRVGDNCPLAMNPDQADDDNDGLGNVCDPLPEDGNLLSSKNSEVKADKTGAVVAFAGDFNKDGFGDYVVATPSFDVLAVPPAKAIKDAGKVEIISGNNGAVLYSLVGTPKTGFGTAVAGNADVNGDGIADVVVSSPLAANLGGTKAMGKVTVIYGCKPVNCTPSTSNVYGDEAKAGFGSALALGDVNNDGNADVIVGASKAVSVVNGKSLKQAGKVVVLSGADLIGDPLLVVHGATAKAFAGTAVAVGDFNGVAGKEVVVGAPNDDQIAPTKIVDAGSVKIYTHGNSTPIYARYGVAAKDYFGKAVAAGADVNGDGINDVLVGAPGLDYVGAGKIKDTGGFFVMYGSASGSYSMSATPTYGSESKSGLGSAVALAYVNNDGFADMIVSAPKATNPTTLPQNTRATGSVTVWQGSSSALFSKLGDPHHNPSYGGKKGDLYGLSLSVGDLNQDRRADLIIGIPRQDISTNVGGKYKLQKDAGSVKVINATAL